MNNRQRWFNIPAAAIVIEALKVVESTALTVPPASCVGLTFDKGNENGFSTVPWGLIGASLSGSGRS